MKARDYLNKAKLIFDIPYVLSDTCSKGAVIVETRIIKDFDLIVKNHLYFLGKDYGLTVFHSDQNELYVKDCLSDVTGVHYHNLGNIRLSELPYNHLLTSEEFWNLVPYEKVLVFQTDSLLLRKGIYLFEAYDYIGAPWLHINKEVGNGGLSLRSKNKMLEVINYKQYSMLLHGNEDIYFSKFIKEIGGTIASTEVAQHFSVETMYYDKPIGVHAADKWLTRTQLETIYTNSLNEL